MTKYCYGPSHKSIKIINQNVRSIFVLHLPSCRGTKYVRGTMKRLVPAILLLSLLTSCAHVISRENRTLAARNVSFTEVLRSPESYRERVFIFGGIIAEIAVSREGTEIEAVQTPVDRFGGIIDPDLTEGRLILLSSRQLDPLVYGKNRLITFAGRLTGVRKKMLGDAEYLYPVFEAREIHLWRSEPYYPYPYWSPYLRYEPFPYYWYHPYRWYRPYYRY